MRIEFKGFILLATLLQLTACSHSLPLISHAHVGHALTSWHDTPAQIGLYAAARDEADEVLSILRSLDSTDADQQQKIYDLQSVAYILNPDVSPPPHQDMDKHYGVIRAMQGVLDHIEYAASSDDASLNFVSSVNDLSVKGEQLINQLWNVFEQSSRNSDDVSVDTRVSQLHTQMAMLVNGKKQADTVVYYGMANFTDDFNAMLEREINPPYEPLPRKYVLGLVKLPNGHWGYNINTTIHSGEKTNATDSGHY